MWSILRSILAASIVVISSIPLGDPAGANLAGQANPRQRVPGQTIPHKPVCVLPMFELKGGAGSAAYINNAGQIAEMAGTSWFDGPVVFWEDARAEPIGLGPLPSGSRRVRGLNSAGEVIITVDTTATQTLSFVWQHGLIRALGDLGGKSTEAMDINDAGQIVGMSALPGGIYRAFVWQDGVMTQLDALDGDFSVAEAINAQGQAAGFSFTGDGTRHASLWQDGTLTDLGALLTGNSYALDINDRGKVVIRQGSQMDGYSHAYVLDAAGVLTKLPAPKGGGAEEPIAINNAGLIIGDYWIQGYQHALLWRNGVPIDLGTLGGGWSYPYALNERGQVVGYSRTSTGTDGAFLWADGVMTELRPLAGGPGIARDINDAGQIVGQETAGNVGRAAMWKVITGADCPTVYLPQVGQ